MKQDGSVPLLDLRRQYASIKDEIDQAIRRVVESQGFIGGPEVSALESEIADLCGTRHAVGCASGSEAILLALMALGVGRGDEVICPAYTFFSTAGSIARLGAVPVFADIDPVTYNITPESARAAARRCRRLAAIMPVHLFGRTADTDAFVRLGTELGVPVIEDAAQAIGSLDERGRPAGSCGAVGCFSFYPSKNLGGYGDGGMVTTSDAELADRLRVLRNHGARRKYDNDLVGLNSRLDALQAAVLRVKLRHLDRWTRARQANARHYDRAFSAAGAVSTATPLGSRGLWLRYPSAPGTQESHIYNQYVIRVPARVRDALRDHLREHRVGTEIYYPVPLHLQPCFASLGYRRGDLPHSESAANETFALPIFPELTTEQLDHVAATIIQFLEKTVEIGVLVGSAVRTNPSQTGR